MDERCEGDGWEMWGRWVRDVRDMGERCERVCERCEGDEWEIVREMWGRWVRDVREMGERDPRYFDGDVTESVSGSSPHQHSIGWADTLSYIYTHSDRVWLHWVSRLPTKQPVRVVTEMWRRLVCERTKPSEGPELERCDQIHAATFTTCATRWLWEISAARVLSNRDPRYWVTVTYSTIQLHTLWIKYIQTGLFRSGTLIRALNSIAWGGTLTLLTTRTLDCLIRLCYVIICNLSVVTC